MISGVLLPALSAERGGGQVSASHWSEMTSSSSSSCVVVFGTREHVCTRVSYAVTVCVRCSIEWFCAMLIADAEVSGHKPDEFVLDRGTFGCF